jgi:hypothetical protein
MCSVCRDSKTKNGGRPFGSEDDQNEDFPCTAR